MLILGIEGGRRRGKERRERRKEEEGEEERGGGEKRRTREVEGRIKEKEEEKRGDVSTQHGYMHTGTATYTTHRNPNSLMACPSHSSASDCTFGLLCSNASFIT